VKTELALHSKRPALVGIRISPSPEIVADEIFSRLSGVVAVSNIIAEIKEHFQRLAGILLVVPVNDVAVKLVAPVCFRVASAPESINRSA